MASLLDTDPRLAAELAEIKTLAGAACVALFGSSQEKQASYRKAAIDTDWFRRYMQAPELWGILASSEVEKLHNYRRTGGQPGKGGLLNLEEVAHAGRATVAAIPGIGRASMAKLDEAISKQEGLEWADGGES